MVEMAISMPSATLSLSPNYRVIPRRTTSQSVILSSSTSAFFENTLTRQVSPLRVQALGRSRPRGMSCNCFFGLGVPELAVIAGVAALVFGPSKLPEVGRNIGKTVKSFQQAAKEFESELKREPDAEEAVEKPSTEATSEEERGANVSSTKESV